MLPDASDEGPHRDRGVIVLFRSFPGSQEAAS
jgi:hypothetical protein